MAHLDLCVGSNHGTEVVDGVDALRVAVRERLRTGSHAIKVMASGGVVSLTDPIRVPQYSREELRAVAEEAGRRGSYVAAHAYSPEAIEHAVLGGARSIEHGNLLDRRSAEVMADHGAVLVPTLVTYFAMAESGARLGMPELGLAKNAEVLDAGRRAIELAAATGIPIGFGTDVMGDLESEQLRGIALQHEVQGTLEVLRSLTSRNADILAGPDIGRIRVGALGDVLLHDGDPSERPELLWTPSPGRVVVKGGVVVR